MNQFIAALNHCLELRMNLFCHLNSLASPPAARIPMIKTIHNVKA